MMIIILTEIEKQNTMFAAENCWIAIVTDLTFLQKWAALEENLANPKKCGISYV